MPQYAHDMTKVEKFGDLVPEEWYHVRVDKGEERDSENSPGEKIYALWLKIQNEPLVGRVIWDPCPLKSTGLSKLKAYYEAVGYTPGPEGHDPENLIGKELWVCVVHDTYKGQVRAKVPGYGIKSLQEGPPVR